MKLKQFKHELRLNYKCDKWAEVMSAWFECSAHIWYRGEHVPDEWEYKVGYVNDPREKDNYYYSIFRKCSVRQLLAIGEFLYRLDRFLRRAGLNY